MKSHGAFTIAGWEARDGIRERPALARACYDRDIGVRTALAETGEGISLVERASDAYARRLLRLAREVILEAAPELASNSEDLDLTLAASFHVLLETQSDALLLAPQRVLTARLWAETVGAQGDVTTLINKAFDAHPDLEQPVGPKISAIRSRFSPKSQKGRDR